MHSWWAEALLRTGDPDRAEGIAAHAVELAIAGGERGSELQARYVMAALAEARGFAEAKSRYDDVRAAAEKLGMLPLVARCHLSLARLYRREAHAAAAQGHADAAMRLFRTTGMLRCPDAPDVR